METKPYNLQSPEQIAKDYGGNKQKIAQGMQMGIIDPTAGTLAGMFIDRMRSAAQQEQAPAQSVAQQVFAPPAPPAPPMGGPPAPAGLGATPQAAQMPPMPGMGGPPPGAPPMGGPPPGPEAPPMGMAEGGMVPPYMAGGGLSDLPLPDDMFDEPRDGGYANGGIVAFAAGGEEPEEMPEIGTTASRYLGAVPAFDIPESISGYSGNALENLEAIKALYTPEAARRKQVTEAYEAELSPEGIKKAKQEDMWMALGQIGAKMATTPGSLLQAASAGIGEALPGIRETAKGRKASQQAALKGLQEQENLTNKQSQEAMQMAMEMKGKYATLSDALQDRGFKDIWQQMDDKTRRYAADLAFGSSTYGSRLQKEGQLGAAGLALDRETSAQRTKALGLVYENIGPGGVLSIPYRAAVQAGKGPEYIKDQVATYLGIAGDGTGGMGNGYGKPPPGAVTRVGR